MQQKRKASAQANGSAKLPVNVWAISGHGALWTRHEKLLNSLYLFFCFGRKATTKLQQQQQQQSLHLPAEVPLKGPGSGDQEQQRQNTKKAQHSTECTRKDEKLKMDIILYVMRVGVGLLVQEGKFLLGLLCVCVFVCGKQCKLSLIKLLKSDKVEQLVEFVSISEKMTALVCFTGEG